MAKKIVGLVAFLALFVGLPYFTYLIVNNKIVIGYNIGYQPDQPIPFSHEMHAGNLKMDCRYCHTAAEQTRHSSVPSLNVCMNCHKAVKKGSRYGEVEIGKIYAAIGFDAETEPHTHVGARSSASCSAVSSCTRVPHPSCSTA